EKTLSKGEHTRAVVVEAAFSLFLEKGYHGTSMRNIAQRAQLALGGIYNHFASKEEIFAAVLDAYHPYRKALPALEQAQGDTIEDFVLDAAHRVKAEMEGFEFKIIPLAFIEMVEFQGRHTVQMVEKFLPTMLAFLQKFGERRGKLRDIPLPLVLRMLFVTFVGYFVTEIVLRRVTALKT